MTVFNVKASQYGATGNGVTNDTAAFNAAFAAAAGGNAVYIPTGTYIVDDVNILHNDVTVFGDSWQSVVKRRSGGAALVFDAPGRTNLKFVNLAIDMVCQSDFTTALNLRSGVDCSVDRCYIYNSGTLSSPGGTTDEPWTNHAVLGNNSVGLSVSNCRFDAVQVKAGGANTGGSFHGPHMQIRNNVFTRAQNLAISYVCTQSQDTLDTIHITGNQIETMRGSGGIYVGSDAAVGAAIGTMYECFIHGNTVSGTWYHESCAGILVRPLAVSGSVVVTDNQIRCRGTVPTNSACIAIKSMTSGQTLDHLLISGNYLNGADHGGIRYEVPGTAATISKNYFEACRGLQVWPAYGTTLLRVESNDFYKCNSYGIYYLSTGASGGHATVLQRNNRSIDCVGTTYEHTKIESNNSRVLKVNIHGDELVRSSGSANYPKYGVIEYDGGTGIWGGRYSQNHFGNATTAAATLAAGSTSVQADNGW